jgi:beta-galactosidase
MEFQPPLAVEGTALPDARSYDRIFDAFYRGLFEAGLQIGIWTAEQLGDGARATASHRPVLVVPAFYIARESELAYLKEYAEAGGHLVLGFKTGYADEDARPRPVLMPGLLRPCVGAYYDEYANLDRPVPLLPEPAFPCDAAAAATAWADGLLVEDATVLARYSHPFYGRWAAITTKEVGSGRVTYVGTLPNQALAVSLARWIRETSLAPDPWAARPTSVSVTSGRTAYGTRLRFVSNWAWQPTEVNVPSSCRDVLSDEEFEPRARLELAPWDVRVLEEL